MEKRTENKKAFRKIYRNKMFHKADFEVRTTAKKNVLQEIELFTSCKMEYEDGFFEWLKSVRNELNKIEHKNLFVPLRVTMIFCRKSAFACNSLDNAQTILHILYSCKYLASIGSDVLKSLRLTCKNNETEDKILIRFEKYPMKEKQC